MRILFIIVSIVLSVAYINATSDLVDENITTWGNVDGNVTESIHIDSTMRQEVFIYPMVGCTVSVVWQQFFKFWLFSIDK